MSSRKDVDSHREANNENPAMDRRVSMSGSNDDSPFAGVNQLQAAAAAAAALRFPLTVPFVNQQLGNSSPNIPASLANVPGLGFNPGDGGFGANLLYQHPFWQTALRQQQILNHIASLNPFLTSTVAAAAAAAAAAATGGNGPGVSTASSMLNTATSPLSPNLPPGYPTSALLNQTSPTSRRQDKTDSSSKYSEYLSKMIQLPAFDPTNAGMPTSTSSSTSFKSGSLQSPFYDHTRTTSSENNTPFSSPTGDSNMLRSTDISTGKPTASPVMPMKRPSKDGMNGRDKVFTCKICNRSFGYKHVLQNHERTHTGEKPFECKVCHKRFTRDHHLKTHMRLHTGEKPYSCTHCDRQFVQVANLRRHLRVHTGERPYKCDICEACFSDSNQLKAHILIHKGEKPFNCELCHGKFRRRHHLMHHACPKGGFESGSNTKGIFLLSEGLEAIEDDDDEVEDETDVASSRRGSSTGGNGDLLDVVAEHNEDEEMEEDSKRRQRKAKEPKKYTNNTSDVRKDTGNFQTEPEDLSKSAKAVE